MIHPLKQNPSRPLQKGERPDSNVEQSPRLKFIQHPVPAKGRGRTPERNPVIPLHPPQQISFIEDLLGDG